MAIAAKELVAGLLRKGFRRDDTHHRYLWLFDGDRKTSVRVPVSHGIRDYGDVLLSRVKKQLGLAKQQQLIDLVRCPMTHEDYISHLLETGRINRR